MTIRSINPANGETLNTYEETSSQALQHILESAEKAWASWSRTPFQQRASLMKKAAQYLRAHKARYADTISQEMGKPIKEAEAEVEKCAWVCDFYADNAERFLAPETVETTMSKSYVAFQPLGVILSIMPWNYPFWQVFRFAAPTLMAGNAALLKHASNVPTSALMIEEVFQEAGFPKDIFRTLLIGSKRVSDVIDNPIVQAVTLTGSTPAGKAVASKAASLLKKAVLELGGSDPYIILEDANIEKAVVACAAGRFNNAGQSCIAAKRFIIVKSVANAFIEAFVDHAKKYLLGDPSNPKTQMGPLARFDLRDQLHEQVIKSIAQGAGCLLGGYIPTEGILAQGAYYPPTVLTDITKGMPAYDEELFGPVASMIVVKDEQEAIKVANDTPFGLAGAVFSQDVSRAEQMAREEIQTGTCFVNYHAFSDPRLPFGGIKGSGYGRELSYFGIREFVNIKTIGVI